VNGGKIITIITRLMLRAWCASPSSWLRDWRPAK
jgi:hypothetical protein